MIDAFQRDAFQLDAFQLEDEDEEVITPPLVGGGGGGAMLSGRFSSGRFVRVDDESVWLDAGPARARARVAAIDWRQRLEPGLARARVTVAPVAISVHVTLAAGAALAQVHVAPLPLTRDDTAEVLRLLALLPKTRPPPTGELAEIEALITAVRRRRAA